MAPRAIVTPRSAIEAVLLNCPPPLKATSELAKPKVLTNGAPILAILVVAKVMQEVDLQGCRTLARALPMDPLPIPQPLPRIPRGLASSPAT